MEVRKVFAATLEKMMRENENIVMLDADLAKAGGTFGLREIFPDRAFDVGIAEANMACVAAGLAAYGFVPFIHSFAPFASRRIFDQIAVSIAYGGNNVKIIGSDPGIAAELNGGTHMSVEDIAIMRAIPGMTVVNPCDGNEMRQAVLALIEYKGPAYLRLGRMAVETVTDAIPGYKFELGKAAMLRDGKDVTIAATGLMVQRALAAAELLAGEGISVRVLDFHTIKPLDGEALLAAAKETGCIVTTEEHSIMGGLGAAVAGFIGEHCPVPVVRHGVNDEFGRSGKAEQVLEAYGLTPAGIVLKVKKALELKA